MQNDQIDLAAFGTRLRDLREKANLSQPQLADILGVQRQTISSWEQGTTAPDVRLLLRLKQELQKEKQLVVDVSSLVGEHRPDTGKTPLEYPLRFLQQLDRSGVRAVYPNRGAALSAFLPFLEKEEKRICLVASSLLGIIRVAPESVARMLERKAKQLAVLMTHPVTSRLRETQEVRKEGSIASEIEESARTLRSWGVPQENIRFYEGAPTIFLLFTAERMLANPYTYQTEAFKTVTFELAPVQTLGEFGEDVYSQYSTTHFEQSWRSTSAKRWEEVFAIETKARGEGSPTPPRLLTDRRPANGRQGVPRRT